MIVRLAMMLLGTHGWVDSILNPTAVHTVAFPLSSAISSCRCLVMPTTVDVFLWNM